MRTLYTMLGPKSLDDIHAILPHEHIFTDLRLPTDPEQGKGEAPDVIRMMKPELDKAAEQGFQVLVECTPEGCGRRVDILKAVAEAANYPIVAATGIYREPWVPDWAHEASEDELYQWMRDELADGVEDLGVQAGFIKLSAGDDGLTDVEKKILRAAVRAAKETGSVIASHTIRGRVVEEQMAVMQEMDYDLSRFIWVHAQVDTWEYNQKLAKTGMWIEYDHVGGGEEDDAEMLRRTLAMIADGRVGQVLLSMDRGWYDPAKEDGGTAMPFTVLADDFLPKLREAGVPIEVIRQLTRDNPFNAFAR